MTDPSAGAPAAPPDVAGRAARGATVLVARGLILRAIGLVGAVAFAAWLGPRQFGILALAQSVTLGGALLMDAGLTTALVRRPTPPSRAELADAAGVQCAMALAIAAVVAAVALAVGGQQGSAVALVVAGLPLTVLKTPGLVAAERRLDFRPLLYVDVAENVVFVAGGLIALALGFGLTGVVVAAFLQAPAGVLCLYALMPAARVLPRWSRRSWGMLSRYSVTVQAANLVSFAREAGMSALIVAVGGAATLGQWSLAYRVIQTPLLVLQPLWKVALPAFARLREQRGRIDGAVQALTGVTGVAVALIVAPLAAAAGPAVVTVLGPEWRPAALMMVVGLAAFTLNGPADVAANSALLAMGRAFPFLWTSALGTAVWCAVVVVGVDTTRSLPVALGYAAMLVTIAAGLVVMLRRHDGVAITRRLLTPAACGVAATALGVLAARAVGDSLWGAAAGAAAGLGAAVVLLRLACAADVRALVSRARASLRRAPAVSAASPGG